MSAEEFAQLTDRQTDGQLTQSHGNLRNG